MSTFTTTVFAACLTLGSAAAMAQGTPGSTGEAGAVPATPGAMKSMPKDTSKDSMPKGSSSSSGMGGKMTPDPK